MDEAQTDIPADKKTNTENIGDRINTADAKDSVKNQAGFDQTGNDPAVKDEIQLADILKPSTLVIALVTLVLFILFGWYVYVLKPALKDNESMIHIIDNSHQKNAHEAAALLPNETIEKSPSPLASIPQKGTETNPDSNGSDSPAYTRDSGVNAGNKATDSNEYKTHKNAHRHKSALASKRSSSSSQNTSKCTQAQIALQQCR